MTTACTNDDDGCVGGGDDGHNRIDAKFKKSKQLSMIHYQRTVDYCSPTSLLLYEIDNHP